MSPAADQKRDGALALNLEAPLKSYIDLPLLAETAATSVRWALDVFVTGDVGLAAKVCREVTWWTS